MKSYGLPGVVVLSLLVAGVAGCDSTGSPASPSSPSGSANSTSVTSSAAPGTSGSPGSGPGPGVSVPPAPGEPATTVVDYRISYDWGVPSNNVEIKHTIVPPIAPPPAPPLPYLTGIYAADHPEGTPAFQRISFYFRGAYPGYRFSYVREVIRDGQGGAIPLPGNSFLQLVFTDAQAHDNSGRSTITASPPPSLGFSALRGYGAAGDFEAHVTYGIGIQVAPNSDQVRQVRVGELKRADGPSKFVYVIFVDIRS